MFRVDSLEFRVDYPASPSMMGNNQSIEHIIYTLELCSLATEGTQEL